MRMHEMPPGVDGRMPIRGVHQTLLFMVTGCIIFLLAGCAVLEQINPFAVAPTPTGQPPLQGTSSPLAPSPVPTITSQTSAHHLILWMPPNFDPHSGTVAGNLLNDRLDEFITAHPGLTLDVRIKAAGGQGGLLDSLSTTNSAAPGAIPSMVVLPRRDMETAALKGLIYPWTDLIKTNPASDTYPYALALGKVQGAAYGLPLAGDALVMVYRPLQVAYAPTSWNEYATRKYPVIFPAADPEALLTSQMLLSLEQTDEQPPETPVVDQTALKKVYIVINDGARSGTFPYWLADFDTFDKGYQAFLDNQANYAVIWASSALNHLPENVSLAPLPAVSANPFTLADGWMLVLTNTSEDQRQMTVALAEYLLDEKFLAAWTEASNLLPTSQTILKQWQNQTDVATINEVASSARPIPSNQYTSSISPILQQGTLGMVRGQINYLQALENSLKGLELVSPTPGG